MSGDAGQIPPHQIDLSVSEVNEPVISEPPSPPSPPSNIDRSRSDLEEGIEASQNEGPEDSAVSTLGNVLKSIIGISDKELKENFQKSMEKDKSMKNIPLRYLKRAARVSGLVIGIAINLSAKVVAFSVAIAFSPVVMAGLTLQIPFSHRGSIIWKSPRDAILTIFSGGVLAGAAAGATIGCIGNLFIKVSLSITPEEAKDFGSRISEELEKAFEDNTAAAAVGATIGTAASLANPLLWRAAWVSKTLV